MRRKRVVSLIASATEIVDALGQLEYLVGRSHECDYPEASAIASGLYAAADCGRYRQPRDRPASEGVGANFGIDLRSVR